VTNGARVVNRDYARKRKRCPRCREKGCVHVAASYAYPMSGAPAVLARRIEWCVNCDGKPPPLKIAKGKAKVRRG